MAIQLYKKGDSHTVRGIQCEVKNFSISDIDIMVADGWVKSPEELMYDSEKEVQEENEADAKEETGENEEEDAELNPVRKKARESGIDGWANKRIKTLEGLLNGEKD